MSSSDINLGVQSYVNTIHIDKNKGDVYLNEVFYANTRQFRNNKKILAVTAAPTLYDLARKLIRGDNNLDIKSPNHISPQT